MTKIYKSKGIKGTDCDTTLEMCINEHSGFIELNKGFLTLMLNKKQGKDLMLFLVEELM